MADDDTKQENIEINDYKDKYLRALADYQNLEKQTQTWKESYSQYATAELIRKLLEILDDLAKAQEHLDDDGLSLVISKFLSVLKSEGLEELDLAGAEFDPNLAEVISTETGDKENIIVKVLQKGYIYKDKVIRPAKVVVSTVK